MNEGESLSVSSYRIICRVIASHKSMLARVSIWITRLWRTGWGITALLGSLAEVITKQAKEDAALFAYDTPLRVLVQGNEKTKASGIWGYV